MRPEGRLGGGRGRSGRDGRIVLLRMGSVRGPACYGSLQKDCGSLLGVSIDGAAMETLSGACLGHA